MLAFYLVSTGTFLNPMTRDELTHDDCLALDAYLSRHGLAAARVADAKRLQAAIKHDGSEESAAAQQQRRQATAVLHGLFGFARYEDSARPRSGGRGEGARMGTAFDDDADASAAARPGAGARMVDDGDVGGDSSTDDEALAEDAFPSLGLATGQGDNGPSIQSGARGEGWRRAAASRGGVIAASARRRGDSRCLPDAGAFPSDAVEQRRAPLTITVHNTSFLTAI